MPVLIRIPTPLQKFTKNQSEVQAEGTTVQEALENLDVRYPGIRERVCDEHGSVRKFINLYLNDEDIRFLEGENTLLNDGDELSIIPAIAGGRGQQAHRRERIAGTARRNPAIAPARR